MPRKNKDEYNEYMRTFMREKAQKMKTGQIKKVEDNDFNPSSANNGRPMLSLGTAADLVKQTQELLKNDGSEEDDPILKAINKYGKYLPLVMQFFKGLQGSIQTVNQIDNRPKIQAPAGWLNSTPMQRLNWKYTRPDWYAAGEAYDLAIETGNMNPAINTMYVDPSYSQPPQDLRSLARKYPDPPLVKDTPTQSPTPQQTSNSDGAISAERPTIEEKTTEGAIQKPSVEQSQESKIISELQADNLKYINLAADYVNGISDEDFVNHLKNIDKLVEQAKPFIPLIPVQVSGMILQTSDKDLETIFKSKCPKKYELIVKEKKVKKLLDLFVELKKII